MQRFKVDPNKQLVAEQKEHSRSAKRRATIEKSNRRKKHIELLKQHFPDAKTVLCLGCRDDSEVKSFLRAGYKAQGIDIANETKYIKKVDAHLANYMFRDKQFDITYTSHSLEHMYDAACVMKNIKKFTKFGVFVILPKGGVRKGVDPAAPCINHPSIFDIMTGMPADLSALLQQQNLLRDFSPFAPYEVVHYRPIKNEIELIFKLSYWAL